GGGRPGLGVAPPGGPPGADPDLPGGGARPAVRLPSAALGGPGLLTSRYDDELCELVPPHLGPLREHLRAFVRELAHAAHAYDLGCGDGRLTVELDAARLTAADVS